MSSGINTSFKKATYSLLRNCYLDYLCADVTSWTNNTKRRKYTLHDCPVKLGATIRNRFELFYLLVLLVLHLFNGPARIANPPVVRTCAIFHVLGLLFSALRGCVVGHLCTASVCLWATALVRSWLRITLTARAALTARVVVHANTRLHAPTNDRLNGFRAGRVGACRS